MVILFSLSNAHEAAIIEILNIVSVSYSYFLVWDYWLLILTNMYPRQSWRHWYYFWWRSKWTDTFSWGTAGWRGSKRPTCVRTGRRGGHRPAVNGNELGDGRCLAGENTCLVGRKTLSTCLVGRRHWTRASSGRRHIEHVPRGGEDTLSTCLAGEKTHWEIELGMVIDGHD